MKKFMLMTCAAALILTVACNSAKRAEAEKKRTQEKMDQLEKDKQDFENKNQPQLR